ncbi:MAG: maleylpyruvate isomerase family mycothiol-dependent enzyme [Sciscionella sp.]
MPARALVDYGRLLDVLPIEAELLVAAGHRAAPDALVPGCPGLTAGETVRHVGSVYRLVTDWVRGGRRPERWQREPDPGQPPEQFVLSNLRQLLAELRAHPHGQPCSTWWAEDESYGFWRRRMVHETIVHRVDVQAAVSDAEPIAEDLAVDGIDEVLTLWFERRLDMLGVTGTRTATVLVRAGDRQWSVRSGPDGARTTRFDHVQDAAADAVVTGAPENIYLWLWGRLPDRVTRCEGNEDAVAQLWALLRLATR